MMCEFKVIDQILLYGYASLPQVVVIIDPIKFAIEEIQSAFRL